jgi:hypothetical protein
MRCDATAGKGLAPSPRPRAANVVRCGAGGQQYASPENSARLQRVGDWEWGVHWCKGGEELPGLSDRDRNRTDRGRMRVKGWPLAGFGGGGFRRP